MHHLAVVHNLEADEESQMTVNIEGTRNTMEFAKAIAATGLYEGVLHEDLFGC